MSEDSDSEIVQCLNCYGNFQVSGEYAVNVCPYCHALYEEDEYEDQDK